MSFRYIRGQLHADQVPLSVLAEKFGTPLYVYSRTGIQKNFQICKKGFKNIPHLICFALKANSSHAVLRELAKLGSGGDIVSGGELFRAMKAGIPANRIVFAGVGKTAPEIEEAIHRGILMFNVESQQELLLINDIAGRIKKIAPISLRVNPDIDPKTHPYISTGLKQHKFGIPIETALKHYRLAVSSKNLKVVGIHMHLGSQIMEVSPFQEALTRVVSLIDELATNSIQIEHLDMGGGIGIAYTGSEENLAPEEVAKAIQPVLGKRKLQLIIEPGRAITGNAGVLLTKVLFRKESGGRNFVVVDAGMNDLIRPSLYNAHHEILSVTKDHAKGIVADVVGPVCETADFLGKQRRVPVVKPDDLMAVMNAGAYGYSMSSNYNSRPRAAEVMVDGKQYKLIRHRETVDDLLRGEEEFTAKPQKKK